MGAKKETQERSKKAKTPAQLAKKAANEAAAALRLQKLQADAKLVKELRAQGKLGSNYSILHDYHEGLKAIEKAAKEQTLAQQKAKDEAEHQAYLAKKSAAQKKYVEETLDGPSGEQYKEWLKGKPASFKNCEVFLKKTGLPRTQSEKDKQIAKEMEKAELPTVEVKGKPLSLPESVMKS